MELDYLKFTVTRSASLRLLQPHEAIDEPVTADAIESQAVGALKFSLDGPEARRPHTRHIEVTPSQSPNLPAAIESARADFLQPGLFHKQPFGGRQRHARLIDRAAR